MSTYRTGRHWGVTIVREGLPADANGSYDQLVAVVVNGDQALAERICALLNADDDAAVTIENLRLVREAADALAARAGQALGEAAGGRARLAAAAKDAAGQRGVTPCSAGRGPAPADGCPCVNCTLARPEPVACSELPGCRDGEHSASCEVAL